VEPFRLLKKMKFFHDKEISTAEAAKIINNYALSKDKSYEWDDFESFEYRDFRITFALNLVWYFCRKYPPANKNEDFGDGAKNYILAISEFLLSDQLAVAKEQDVEFLKKDTLPIWIAQMFGLK
jgi:hypothetical protein